MDLDEIYGGTKGFWDEMAAANKETKSAEAPAFSVDAQKAADVNISLNGAESSDFTYDEEKGDNADYISVDGKADETPAVSVDGKVDETPSVSVDGKIEETPAFSVSGNMENPDYTYDAEKGQNTDPITVKGDLSHLQENSTSEQNPQNTQAEQVGTKTPNFADGFKLSEEARERLDEKFKDYSTIGIMERFASSKEPEEAFMAIFLGMMLYLPNQALKYMEQREVTAKERKSYIENQAQAYDETFARGRGWTGKDQFDKVYGDFVDTFGNMPEMAAKLRNEHPELLKGLGLKFDENGRLEGKLNDKQVKALSERVIANNYDKTYGHRPTDKQLKALWADCNNLLKAGVFAQLGKERVAEEASLVAPPAVQPTEENASSVEDSEEEKHVVPPAVQPTEENVSSVEDSEEEKHVAPPAVQPTEVNLSPQEIPLSDVKNVQVDTLALADEKEIKGKVVSVDAQSLEPRPPMNLQAAHDFSIRTTTPTALKYEVSQYNVAFDGLRAKEQDVQANRDALNAARQPRGTLQPGNANNISLTVDQGRA